MVECADKAKVDCKIERTNESISRRVGSAVRTERLRAQSLHKAVQRAKDTFKAGIGLVNHTDRYIYTTSVDGSWGRHAHRMSAGIAGMCCVTLPATWRPRLTVRVGWDMPEGTTHVPKSKIVEVEKYDAPGEVYVHFFPNDEVRVVVTTWVGASPNHPITPPPGAMMPRY